MQIKIFSKLFLVIFTIVSTVSCSLPNKNNNYLSTSDVADQYYFGYGSNISQEFMHERLRNGEWTSSWTRAGYINGPIPIDLGVYYLENYEFAYNLDTEPFGDPGVAANIIKNPGSRVYGVLYRISKCQLEEIDKSEDEPIAYKRVQLTIKKMPALILNKRNDGLNSPEQVTAYVYVGQDKYITYSIKPEPEYVDIILKGANEHNFPRKYVNNYLIPKTVIEVKQSKQQLSK